MGFRIPKPMDGTDWNRSPKLMDRLDKIGQASVMHLAKTFLFNYNTTPPHFSSVEIETVNRCNNDCPFCPVNRNNDTRKPARMDEALLKSIVDQLANINYSGQINLFSNNEPLLDNRIFDFIDYARKRLPNALHVLYTNGILLDNEKFQRLIRSLDSLIIDNYDDNFQLMPNIQKILDANNNLDFKCDVEIALRKKNQKLYTRAGSAPNRLNEYKYRPHSACNLPFTQLIIRPNGTIGKCCNDPLNEISLGDLNSQSILEVWYGKPFQEFRKEMYFNGRQRIKGCEFCDVTGLYTNLPPSTKPDEHQRLANEIALRKSLSAVYIFDTIPLSQMILQRLEIYGVKCDGIIDFRNDGAAIGLKHITLEQALSEQAFILIPTPYYDDNFFETLNRAGYQYERDYLIYTPNIW